MTALFKRLDFSWLLQLFRKIRILSSILQLNFTTFQKQHYAVDAPASLHDAILRQTHAGLPILKRRLLFSI